MEKLNISKWKPKYVDLNTYALRFNVMLNNEISLGITSNGKTYLCIIDGKYYFIPASTYEFLKSYK